MIARRALAVVTLLSVARPASADPCAPRARLDGDAAAVASVAAELARLGVAVTSDAPSAATTSSHDLGTTAASCPVVVAAVELDRDGGIAVAVRDGTQRSEGRVLSDASLAAAWIDSWLRDDFDAPGFALPPSPRARVAPVAAPGSSELAATVATPQRPLLEQVAFTAALDQAWTGDATRWTGLSGGACVHVGGLCVGGRLRYAMQDVATGQTAAARRDLSVLATSSLSTDIGRMTVTPELGLGVGRLATSRLDGCKPPPCDPNDPTCSGGQPPPPIGCTSNPDAAGAINVGDNLAAATWTPRAAAALRIAVPLFDHVWLDGIAAVTLAPFGHGDPFVPSTGTVPLGVPPEVLALPGEPLTTFLLGIGLRLGAP